MRLRLVLFFFLCSGFLAAQDFQNELDLSKSNLKELPLERLNSKRDAIAINASQNKLFSPAGIEGLAALSHADLSRNRINQLKELCTLTELISLDLHTNFLETLPACFSDLPLRWLDLSANEFQAFPLEITELDSLISLNLGYHKFEAIPDEIERMVQLEELKLNNCKLKSVNKALFTLNRLKFLELSGNKLAFMPAELALATSLEFIDLSYNKLGELPKPIRKLGNLKELNIAYNNIVRLPDWLVSHELNTLVLSGNQQLDWFHTWEMLAECRNLKTLVLQNMGAISFNYDFRRLGHLEVIDFTANQLSFEQEDYLRLALPNTRLLF